MIHYTSPKNYSLWRVSKYINCQCFSKIWWLQFPHFIFHHLLAGSPSFWIWVQRPSLQDMNHGMDKQTSLIVWFFFNRMCPLQDVAYRGAISHLQEHLHLCQFRLSFILHHRLLKHAAFTSVSKPTGTWSPSLGDLKKIKSNPTRFWRSKRIFPYDGRFWINSSVQSFQRPAQKFFFLNHLIILEALFLVLQLEELLFNNSP